MQTFLRSDLADSTSRLWAWPEPVVVVSVWRLRARIAPPKLTDCAMPPSPGGAPTARGHLQERRRVLQATFHLQAGLSRFWQGDDRTGLLTSLLGTSGVRRSPDLC